MKKILAIVFAMLFCGTLGFSAAADDVKQPVIKTDYGCAAFLHDLGLLAGVGKTADGNANYDLSGKLTRAQTVTLIVRFLGAEKAATAKQYAHPFKDVPAWADPYIGYAYKNGVTSGRSETAFDPDGEVDAIQFVTLLLRAIGYSDAKGDFVWNRPFVFAKNIGVMNSVNAPQNFDRADAFRICVRTLYAKAANGKLTWENMEKDGLFTKYALENAAKNAENASEPTEKESYRVLTVEEYLDKTKAGFLSQIVGVFSGYEFVRQSGKLYVGMPDSWYSMLAGPYAFPNTHNKHESKLLYNNETKIWESWMDDDYSIDVLNLYILKDMYATYGTVASKIITDDWVKYNVYDMGGGNRDVGAYALMSSKRYLPAFSGSAEYGNRYNYCSEPCIENETLGMVTAGMPNAAADLTKIFANVTGDSDNVDWTIFYSTMYAMAYFEKDIPTLICKAAEVFGEGTYEREVVDICFEIYEKYPDNWRTGMIEAEKAVLRKHDRMSETALELEVNVNSSFILLGLLYGKGNYDETCKIISLAGYDGDCTAAMGLSVLGIMYGSEILPQKVNMRVWQDGQGVLVNRPIDGIKKGYWMCMLGLPERIKMTEVIDLYQENFESILLENGGKIENGRYYIPNTDFAVPDVVFYEDFESKDTTPYASFGAGLKLTTTNIYEGVYSARVNGSSDGESGFYRTVTGLKAGSKYSLTCYVRTDANTSAEIFAREKGTNGTFATVHDQSEYYVRRTFVFTASASSMEIGVRVPAGTKSGSGIYVDHMTLIRIEETAVGTAVIESPTESNTYSGMVTLNVTGTVGKEVLLKIGFANATGRIFGVGVTIGSTRFNSAPLYKTGNGTDAGKADFVYIPIVLSEGTNQVKLNLASNKVYIRSIEVVTLTDRF